MVRLFPVLLLVALCLPWGKAISYTVQVAALSDQESALEVQRTLLESSYPAYVVRAAVAQGDIYRVRVGAFANRAAALLYAETMPPVAGGQPLPALAEGIPSGVMPLQPRILAEAVGELDVVPWEGGVALRLQPDATKQANYQAFQGAEPLRFEAWRAQPQDGAVLWLRNLPLWPEGWQDETQEVRAAFGRAELEALASRLSLDPAELEPLVLRPAFGPPYLVVLERVDHVLADGGMILGVAGGSAEPSGYGPDTLAYGSSDPMSSAPASSPFESVEIPGQPEPLYRASLTSRPAATDFSGEGWEVTGSGSFFLLSLEGGRGWRAGIGTPLWSDGRFLLTRSRDRLILYDFVVRP